MTSVTETDESNLPPVGSTEAPRQALTRLLMGQVVAQAIAVAADLAVADLLVDGPRGGKDLAAATGTDPLALARLLRALAGVGVFAEVEPGRFGLTPPADCLREDRPDSGRPAAILYGEEYRRALDGLLWSVRTGAPAFDQIHGLPFFAYLGQRPEVGARFDRNMAGRHGARNAAVAAAYDFSSIARLVEVGGGEGQLLRAVLGAYAGPRGVLFDLPAVIERARRQAGPVGGDRLDFDAGDMFEGVTAGADGYLLASVLHDWDDERALAILRNVRRAIAPGGRLLLVEEVLPGGTEPSPARLLDLLMLVLPGGRERTIDEFRGLLAGAGFALTGVVPTGAGASVIEARPI